MKLTISGSPHIHSGRTTSGDMWRVVIALIPAFIAGLYFFGIGAAIVCATSVATCVLTEYLITRFMLKRPSTIKDGSAVITGILLAMNLPSNIPFWIVIIGAVFSIAIVKMAFGGLGCNIFNPAIAGRVFLLISFPMQMTSWPLPVVNQWNYTDAATGATILSKIKLGEMATEQFDIVSKTLGEAGGSIGEISFAAIIVGFIFLLVTKTIKWYIPVSIVATAAFFSLLVGGNPIIEVMSGGLLLGAVFMATDYVTSPMTKGGMFFYGIMIGLITIIIRHWGVYPEGVSFAILIMNGFTPLINRMFKPTLYGKRRAVGA